MQRIDFLKSLGKAAVALPMVSKLTDLEALAFSLAPSERMPVLFLGHGSPMNAIEDNAFVQGFKRQALHLPHPQTILVVSAHWETRGTQVTAMAQPRTIHDFGGFPPALYEVQYPAPGNPQLAEEITALVAPEFEAKLDHAWGLDHGSWSVIKHLYPNADVPVLQLSLDTTKTPEQHYALAAQLALLRERGVLIVGSGNIVHNLRRVAWDKINDPFAFDWAAEAREKINAWILAGDHTSLMQYRKHGSAFDLAIPTPEHYLPLLYCLALQQKGEQVVLFNDEPLAGSLSMTSLKIG